MLASSVCTNIDYGNSFCLLEPLEGVSLFVQFNERNPSVLLKSQETFLLLPRVTAVTDIGTIESPIKE